MTIDAVSRHYGRSKGWLSTLENGLHTVDPQELADLLDFYRVPDGPLRESLLHLAVHDPSEGWQRTLEGRISAAALDLASLEEDSALIRTFQPCIVPGLLQVPDYTHALIQAGPPSFRQNSSALVEFRGRRQRVLTGPDSPRYVPIISESALRQPTGGHAVMRAQLQRLWETAQLDHVELHVLPASASACLWLAGPFILITLRPPGHLTVSIAELFTKSLFTENEDEVADHEKTFERLLAASLDENASLELIERIASQT